MKLTVLGGGGWVGSAAAFHIAALGLADEIVLVGGRRTSMTEQHAFDLSTAVSTLGVARVRGRATTIWRAPTWSSTPPACRTPADRAGMLARNIVLLREIAGHVRAHCPEAVIITATNPVDPLNYATWRAGGFARRQVDRLLAERLVPLPRVRGRRQGGAGGRGGGHGPRRARPGPGAAVQLRPDRGGAGELHRGGEAAHPRRSAARPSSAWKSCRGRPAAPWAGPAPSGWRR